MGEVYCSDYVKPSFSNVKDGIKSSVLLVALAPSRIIRVVTRQAIFLPKQCVLNVMTAGIVVAAIDIFLEALISTVFFRFSLLAGRSPLLFRFLAMLLLVALYIWYDRYVQAPFEKDSSIYSIKRLLLGKEEKDGAVQDKQEMQEAQEMQEGEQVSTLKTNRESSMKTNREVLEPSVKPNRETSMKGNREVQAPSVKPDRETSMKGNREVQAPSVKPDRETSMKGNREVQAPSVKPNREVQGAQATSMKGNRGVSVKTQVPSNIEEFEDLEDLFSSQMAEVKQTRSVTAAAAAQSSTLFDKSGGPSVPDFGFPDLDDIVNDDLDGFDPIVGYNPTGSIPNDKLDNSILNTMNQSVANEEFIKLDDIGRYFADPGGLDDVLDTDVE